MLFFKNIAVKNPNMVNMVSRFSFYHERGFKSWELMYQSKDYEINKKKQKCLIDEAISFNSKTLQKTSKKHLFRINYLINN
jgi:hypothetical protein